MQVPRLAVATETWRSFAIIAGQPERPALEPGLGLYVRLPAAPLSRGKFLEMLPLSLDIAALLRLPQESAAAGLMPAAWLICRPSGADIFLSAQLWLADYQLMAQPGRRANMLQAGRAISNVGGAC